MEGDSLKLKNFFFDVWGRYSLESEYSGLFAGRFCTRILNACSGS